MFWTCPKFWAIFVADLVFLEFVETSTSNSYIHVLFPSKKQQNWFWKNIIKKLPDSSLSNVFNFLLIGLQHTLSFEWPDFKLKVSHQNSMLVHEIFQFLKQAVSVIWHADSNLVIIMEMKRKVEFSWACTFLTSWCFKGYRNLPLAWDGVRYKKFSIAKSMTHTIFLKIFNMYLSDL